jgi:hypothetical protein
VGFSKLPEKGTSTIASGLANHPLYPNGYTLVVRVEVIRRIFNTMPLAVHERIISGHNQALDLGFVGGIDVPGVETEEPVRLSDYPIERQGKLRKDFAYGLRASSTSNALYFVDIEPYILSNDLDFVLPYTPNLGLGPEEYRL